MFKKAIISSLLGLFFNFSFADNCAFTVEATDQMNYVQKEIPISKSCKQFKLTLKHIGKMPKTAMGHNVVITEANKWKKVAADGIKAGAKSDYVKPNDPNVKAHTKMLGGGQSDTITIDVSKLKNGDRAICTFPAHANKMNIPIVLK